MKVLKTLKQYINGKLVRSESGRTFSILDTNGKYYAHVCHGSKKDFRNAIDFAINAHKKWSSSTAFLKSQILYRMAEMMEGKKNEFVTCLSETTKLSKEESLKEVENAISHFVYYAGFCDKFQQILGSVNPVSGPFHNFTTAESIGVVTLLCDEHTSFAKLIEDICVIILSGNSLVVILTKEIAVISACLSEVFATSDLPGGVVNLLTGFFDELAPFISTHREVRAVSFQRNDKKQYHHFKSESSSNMKRVIGFYDKSVDPLKKISDFVEFKTVWHPIGI